MFQSRCLRLLVLSWLLVHPGVATQVSLLDGDWTRLAYDGIPANDVVFAEDRIQIEVNRSAGSIARSLSIQQPGQRLLGKVQVFGNLNLEPGQTQGESDAEDCILRVGVVFAGDRNLSRLEQIFAPGWVRQLAGVLPEGKGVDRVIFYSLASDSKVEGRVRSHPLSERIEERFILEKPESGNSFEFSVALPDDETPVALWIGADGDDTGSSYRVVLTGLRLKGSGDLCAED